MHRENQQELRQEVLRSARRVMQDEQPRTAWQIASALRDFDIHVHKSLVGSVLTVEGRCEYEYDRLTSTYRRFEPDYSDELLQPYYLGSWNGQEIVLFRYPPLRYQSYSGRPNSVTSLIINFKNGAYNEDEIIMSRAVDEVGRHEEELFEDLNCRYILAAPRSSAGTRNVPCEFVAEIVADVYGLTYISGALERTLTIPKSSSANDLDERPSVETHLRTIRYVGSPLYIPNESIILVDDVLTHGHTSAACRLILESVTQCRSVIGLFAAKT